MNKLYRAYNDAKEQQRWWFVGAVVALIAFGLYHKMSITLLYNLTKDLSPKSFGRIVAELFIMGAPYIATQVMAIIKNFTLRDLCYKMESTGNRDLVIEAGKTRPFLNLYIIVSVLMIVVFIAILYIGGMQIVNNG
jgi:hypothetical protein